jgi:hypothetical protein
MPSIARRWGVAASLLLILIALALAAFGGDGKERVADGAPRLAGVEELTELGETLGHDVYWAGERPPSQIEVTEEPDGNVYLRYLPPDAEAGDSRSGFLTVGTYPIVDPVGALRDVAAKEGTSLERSGDAFVLASSSSEGSAYLAYPGSELQIEVYDPGPGQALELVRAGAIRPVG